MTIRYYFKNMTRSPSLEFYAKSKLEQIDHFVDQSHPIQITILQDRRDATIRITCHSKDRHPIEVQSKSESFHKSVDGAIDKLLRAVKKRKERRKGFRGNLSAERLDRDFANKELEANVSSAI